MAIVKMRKFTLLAYDTHKESLLRELQRFEDVHFKRLDGSDAAKEFGLYGDQSMEKVSALEAELVKIKFAMSKTEQFAEKAKGLKALVTEPKTIEYGAFLKFHEAYDYSTVFEKVKACDEELNSIKSRISGLHNEIESLRPWVKLDAPLEEFERVKSIKCILGAVNRTIADGFRVDVEHAYKDVYMERLGDIKDDSVFLLMTPAAAYEEIFTYTKQLGMARLTPGFKGVPAETIKADTDEIAALNAGREKNLSELKSLAGEYEKLNIALESLQTALERERVCQNFLRLKTTVLMEGWVPAEDAGEFRKIISSVCGGNCFLEEEDAEKDAEDVPIKLKNNKMAASFENITKMFSMPKYNEVDPTPIMMPFYLLFFGLMMGDSGVGLLMLIGTSAALKFFKLKPGGRNFMQFFFYLSIATIFGGILYGSLFGYSPSFMLLGVAEDGTRKAILDTQTDVVAMMLVSVALGVIQVLFGVGVKGYILLRDKQYFAAFCDSLLTILALSSALGMLLNVVGIIPEALGAIMSPIFVLSLIGIAATQGRENPTPVGKVAGGIYAVYGMTSYVGDIVSYTRVAALALSGAYIAFSFNLMADLVPWFLGWIIFLAGVLLNLGLSALGAYVHTCRLQYVEFFGKFYEGGGVEFNPFKLQNNFITVLK